MSLTDETDCWGKAKVPRCKGAWVRELSGPVTDSSMPTIRVTATSTATSTNTSSTIPMPTLLRETIPTVQTYRHFEN